MTQMVWGVGWTFASGADVAWITDEIAIGDWRDALNADLLRGESVCSMLSLIGKLVGHSAESLGVQRVEVFSPSRWTRRRLRPVCSCV